MNLFPSERKKLSPIAGIIVERYREKTNGGYEYLSDRMKFAELTAAMHYAMLMEYPSNPNEPIGAYVNAINEAAEHLEL